MWSILQNLKRIQLTTSVYTIVILRCCSLIAIVLLFLSSPVINTMQRGSNEHQRVKNEASRDGTKRKRFRSRNRKRNFDMDLYRQTMEDFDWNMIDYPSSTENDLQLYMHDDLQRLMDVPDEQLISVLRQPRGAILFFIVRRFESRISAGEDLSIPHRYTGRIFGKKRETNYEMQVRLQTILRDVNGPDPPDAAMKQLDQDLRTYLREQRWEEVQCLLNAVPEGTFVPILTDSSGWTLLHVAVHSNADLTIVKGLTKVFAPGEMRRIRVHHYTALRHCYAMNAPSEVRDHILATWPPAAFLHRLQDVLNRENGASILNSLIDACPGAIDYIHQYNSHRGSGWCWKTLLHLAVSLYLEDTDDASTKFNIELDSIVTFLLMRKPELAETIDEELRTPMHLACSSPCKLSTLKIIMAYLSAEQLMVCDMKGKNALHYAMSASFEHPDRLEIVGELLHASYDLIYQRSAVDPVSTPIDCLLANTSVEWTIGLVPCFQRIFAHGTHSHITRSGALVLHSALYDEDLAMRYFRSLLRIAPEQAKEFDDVGNLPIHLAAQMEKAKCTHPVVEQPYLEILDELVNVFPEGLSTPNRDGMLPLQLMIQAGGRWSGGIQRLIQECPAAVYDLHLQGDALATFLSRLDGHTIMYKLLRDVPHLLLNN
jgi:hypothetical protein